MRGAINKTDDFSIDLYEAARAAGVGHAPRPEL